VEDAARTLRYAFLEQAASRLDACAIAVGHSRDDQAETFLLRLVRGAGPRGLAGIRPKAGLVIRPLLDISRAELRSYAAARNLLFREDASNQDLAIPRNRVRHELLPYLERHFSPGIAAVLAREASIARDDEEHLEREAIDLARSVVLTTEGPSATVQLDCAAITAIHPSLAGRVLRTVLQARAGGAFVGFEAVDGLLEFARTGRPGAALSLPGQQAVHLGTTVELHPEPPRVRGVDRRAQSRAANSFSIPLSIPGEVRLDKQGWAISAELVGAADLNADRPGRGPVVGVDAEPLRLPLSIRSRRDGDRFEPDGSGRRTKLKDFLIDRKIPREMRDALPLVVDGNDRIVWVVGHSVAADFRVTGRSRGVILLKSRRLGGLG
jgi:tRNA(Ile)-lysidine synthase